MQHGDRIWFEGGDGCSAGVAHFLNLRKGRKVTLTAALDDVCWPECTSFDYSRDLEAGTITLSFTPDHGGKAILGSCGLLYHLAGVKCRLGMANEDLKAEIEDEAPTGAYFDLENCYAAAEQLIATGEL